MTFRRWLRCAPSSRVALALGPCTCFWARQLSFDGWRVWLRADSQCGSSCRARSRIAGFLTVTTVRRCESETTTVVTRPLGERESIIETAQRRREKAIAVCVRLWLAWTRARTCCPCGTSHRPLNPPILDHRNPRRERVALRPARTLSPCSGASTVCDADRDVRRRRVAECRVIYFGISRVRRLHAAILQVQVPAVCNPVLLSRMLS